MRRVHIVLIPGFGGFDALGQLEYYAGITPSFRSWSKQNGRRDLVLRYFDNFPTAAVVTRAGRLRRYLAKRMARGEIVPGMDCVVLVGHSTGGLDIRQLVWDLSTAPQQPLLVDGATEADPMPTTTELLNLVRGVVFLSVPQWGTHIADWVRAHPVWRKLVVNELRLGAAGTQVPLLNSVEGWITGGAAEVAELDLLRAVEDALNEASVRFAESDPTRIAETHEAAAFLELWLRHMAWDFSAIEDLSTKIFDAGARSPAQFRPATHPEEAAAWERIEMRSYATVSRRPFRFKSGAEAPVWDLLKPLTYPELMKDSELSEGTDSAYRLCYRACAGAPARHGIPGQVLRPKYLSPAHKKQLAELGIAGRIEPWDNDGIVNTASMFWPKRQTAFLVPGDHLDIVGHFQRVNASNGDGGRKYQAYDLLRSASGFNVDIFRDVWHDIFEFCAGFAEQARAAAAGG